MIKNLTTKLTGTRNAVTGALDDLDVLRSQIAEKRNEIEALHRAPVPVSEALEQFDKWAADRAEQAVQSLRPELLSDPANVSGEMRLPDLSYRLDGEIARADHRADEILYGLILATAMPAFRSIVEERIEAATAGRECLTAAERVERIERAEAELLDLELQEESVVRSLEGAGLPVERRADASPVAVLCAAVSLPT
jgi:hypothetical protein